LEPRITVLARASSNLAVNHSLELAVEYCLGCGSIKQWLHHDGAGLQILTPSHLNQDFYCCQLCLRLLTYSFQLASHILLLTTELLAEIMGLPVNQCHFAVQLFVCHDPYSFFGFALIGPDQHLLCF
jgi:hypothetical protein